MTKKEISEIKKLMNIKNHPVYKISGCYVDLENNKTIIEPQAFESLDEEKMHKYLALLKKGLSGNIGKNIFEIEFTTEQESNDSYKILTDIKNNKFEEDDINNLYDTIIANYTAESDYFILLAYCIYDVPVKKDIDGFQDDMSSDDIYTFLMCNICPIKQTKAHLMYDPGQENISDYPGDKELSAPSLSFTFPAFNNRSEDIHALLFYAKKMNDVSTGFISDVLQATPPLSSEEVTGAFAVSLEEALGKDCNAEFVFNLNDNLKEKLEYKETQIEEDGSSIVPTFSVNDITKALTECGADNDKVSEFEKLYEENYGDNEITAAAIIDNKLITAETDDILLKVNAERTDLIEEVIENGHRYLKIRVDDELKVGNIHTRRSE